MGAAVLCHFRCVICSHFLSFPSVNYVGRAMESSAGQGARAPYG